MAFVLRLAAVIHLQAWKNPGAMEHRGIAVALLRGEGFAFNEFGHYGPSSVQSPPYPLLLALLYAVFGPGTTSAHVAAMVLNCLVGAATCAMTFLLARRLGTHPIVATLAASLVAVWPTQIYAVTVVQAVSLITLCTVAIVWLFYLSVDTRRMTPWLGFSFVGCLGALTEPVLLPFMVLSGVVICFWRGLPIDIRLRNALLLLLTALVVLLPWSYRNYRVHGHFVPVKNTVWVNIWKGNNPNATGTDRIAMSPDVRARLGSMTDTERRDPTVDSARQYDLLTAEQSIALWGRPEYEREQLFREWTTSWISSNPIRFAQLCGIRLLKSLWIEWDNPKAQLIYVIARTTLVAGSLIGLILAIRLRLRLFIPLLVFGSGLLTYTLTIAAARFALPYEPWQLILIAVLMGRIAGRLGWFGNARLIEPRP
jgi:hypothetical protein